MILYLDTSSLVKLYVEEEGSPAVRALVDKAAVSATAVIAYAEARSAFARRFRERSLTRAEAGRVKAALDLDWPHLLTMDINQGIAQQAGELAEKHALKGFDGLHLACYLALRSLVAEEVEFSSFDAALDAAARAEAGDR